MGQIARGDLTPGLPQIRTQQYREQGGGGVGDCRSGDGRKKRRVGHHRDAVHHQHHCGRLADRLPD